MSNTLATALAYFKPAIALAWLVDSRLYILLRVVLLLVMIVCVGVIAFLFVPSLLNLDAAALPVLASLPWTGLALLTGAAYIVLRALNFFYNDRYFHGLDSHIGNATHVQGTTYEVARVLLRGRGDVTAAFVSSPFGKQVLLRTGITPKQLRTFVKGDRTPVIPAVIDISFETQFTLLTLGKTLLAGDKSLQTFLKELGITETTYLGALQWTYKEHLARKRNKRWWSRDTLSKTRSIGREFSYGIAYTLGSFTKPIVAGAVYADLASNPAFAKEYVSQIETILARDKDANVLLVGEAGVGKLDALIAVGSRMERGVAVGSIVGMHLVLLDTERLVAVANDKALFEQTLLTLLSEAENAGNIVLVIDKLPAFLANTEVLGVDVVSLLDPYLSSPFLHVIATTDPATYHQSIETNGGLLRRFEAVLMESPDEAVVIDLLESIAGTYERVQGVMCTYSAIAAIAEDADRFIVAGVMPDKAVHLLNDVYASARTHGTRVITKDIVDVYVATKTGVPVGPVSSVERDTLLNLEAVLHERIVGQERAVDAISGVMRRSRAGIHDAHKPIGSFLFLGPTGVGKTKTAKALAGVFFKREDAMHRIDMSEFSGSNALERLIGGGGHTGILSNMLKEHPYAVVLLDEFEKAGQDVHNIFLQILDEGIFTDGLGQKINARNSIIIATSNAGSERILEWMDAGESLADKKDSLIDHLVSRAVYKPELINRFDDVILFSPLSQSEQGVIGKAMLVELQSRIREKGYELAITDELVAALVAVGYKPEFGARPMRRAIQEVVEEAIAEKIIAGTVAKGATITFTPAELDQITLRR